VSHPTNILAKVLYVHRSERADRLAEALAEVLSEPLADPIAHEVVAVPTRGVERWLCQRLSQRLGTSLGGRGGRAAPETGEPGPAGDGVCANIDWPFPGALVAMATAAASAPAGTAGPRGAKPAGFPWWLAREADPWRPESLAWAVTQLIDEHLGDPFLEPLRAHLLAASPEREGLPPRRFAVARHIADLLDSYAVHRPEMLVSWQGATATSATSPSPSAGPASQVAGSDARITWQAELYSLLCRRLSVPGPAERLEMAIGRIESSPDLLAPLPARLSCFGLTRLPTSQLKVLRAIATHRDVHLFLLHPSGALWDKVHAHSPKPPEGLERATDTTSGLAANPLLRSWGRDAREMQLVLAAQGIGGSDYRPVGEAPLTLLSRIQADIRADRPPPGPPGEGEEDQRPVLSESDHSLQVHSCHGRARQVEVVREAVLHLLARHVALEPRDVIVMCPDIEEFAPLIKATFAAASFAGGPEVRAKLADRSIRQTNPVLAVTAQLLDLASSRVTATQVMDLISAEPVRRRFGFDEDALASIERWVAGTGVCWGLDAGHRAAWKLGYLAPGTWRAGLDRLLLGVAMDSDGGVFEGTLPYDDIGSDEIELAGRFAELLERLRSSVEPMRQPQALPSWADILAKGTGRLVSVAPGQEWQLDELAHVLEDTVSSARLALTSGDAPLLDAAEVREILADRLRGRPTRANFRTGEVTICTLVPMRSVPHRVVCLLGLDDGAFPRSRAEDGDNLLLSAPRVGDRDASSEDRQLILDALLAATEHLVITYEGHDQHLNRGRPPSVPVAELLDVIDQTVRLEDPGQPARAAVTFEHPLQAFDQRNYTPGAILPPTVGRNGGRGAEQPGEPWRFDPLYLKGAEALGAPKAPTTPFLERPLAPLDGGVVQLASLIRWLEHPTKAFLRERLGYYVEALPEPLSGSLPLELGPLQRWALGDRLLSARLSGKNIDEACAIERATGLLPPGAAGEEALRNALVAVEAIVAALSRLECSSLRGEQVEVRLSLPDGRTLIGSIPDVHGATVLRCVYSKLGAKHRLRAWAQFLALSAYRPDLQPTAVTIGQSEGSKPGSPRICTQFLGPWPGGPEPGAKSALEALSELVHLYDLGMREPLPIFCATSAAWAEACLKPERGESPRKRAQAKWSSSYDKDFGEASEPEHMVVLGGKVDLDRLLEASSGTRGANEVGAHNALRRRSEESRFSRLACQLWGTVLAHEQLRER
jgi:exodeoxyribonuclease V gamma subunit